MLEIICLLMQSLLLIGIGALCGFVGGYFKARKLNNKDLEHILDEIKSRKGQL